MKKQNLPLFFNVLKETKLNLVDSRVRDAFTRKLIEFWKIYDEEKSAIFNKLCDKGKDGKPLLNDKNEYKFSGKKFTDLQKELSILESEEVELTITPEILQIIERTNYTPAIGEIERIDAETESVPVPKKKKK